MPGFTLCCRKKCVSAYDPFLNSAPSFNLPGIPAVPESKETAHSYPPFNRPPSIHHTIPPPIHLDGRNPALAPGSEPTSAKSRVPGYCSWPARYRTNEECRRRISRQSPVGVTPPAPLRAACPNGGADSQLWLWLGPEVPAPLELAPLFTPRTALPPPLQ